MNLDELRELLDAAGPDSPFSLEKHASPEGHVGAFLIHGTAVEACIYVEETADLIFWLIKHAEEVNQEIEELGAQVRNWKQKANDAAQTLGYNRIATDRAGREVVQLRKELEELRSSCTCGDTYLTYEGPQIDCPSHGAMRALHDLRKELQNAHHQAIQDMREIENRRDAAQGGYE